MTRATLPACSRFIAAVALSAAANGTFAAPASVDAVIPAAPDCLEDAASFHRTNTWVLRAIIWHESSNRANIVVRNHNGSVDVGLGQINSVHYSELGLYHVAPSQLLDSCVNTYVAAWLLAKQIKRHGNTWEAVGAYHSETPSEKWLYVSQIQRVLTRWQVLQSAGPPSQP